MARIASRSRAGSGGSGSDAAEVPSATSGGRACLNRKSGVMEWSSSERRAGGSEFHRQADRNAAPGRGVAVQYTAGGNGGRQVSGRPVFAVGDVAYPGVQLQAGCEVPVRVQV